MPWPVLLLDLIDQLSSRRKRYEKWEGQLTSSDFATGLASRGVVRLLLVPVLLAAVATERMRLVAALSLSLSSLRLYTSSQKVSHWKRWSHWKVHGRVRNGIKHLP